MNIFERPGSLRYDQMMGSYEFLARKRIIFCYGEIASLFMGASPSISLSDVLLALDMQSHDPIKLVIDSPGGAVVSGFNLCDTMKLIKSPIWTIGRTCCSMAALILASGTSGYRFLHPHSKVMLHLPWGSVGGDVEDVKIQTKEMDKIKDAIIDILMNNGVKKSKKQLLKDIDREFWMGAREAIDYGLADRMVGLGIFDEDLK